MNFFDKVFKFFQKISFKNYLSKFIKLNAKNNLFVSIITLTTDYGLKDPSVSIIKGMIYSQNNSCVVVDITHKISPFNKYEASYTIKNSYTAFPRGSVHIIDVDAKQNPEQNLITVFLDDHYFISANNGIVL